MSSYFKAAELCGLRANTEGFKRAAHRSVATSSPAVLREETAAVAQQEARAVVVSIGARPPPTDIMEVNDNVLPFADDRQDHLRRLNGSAVDIAQREDRDLSDYQQEQKVQALRDHQLQVELQAEREAAEEERRQQDAREAAVQQTQEATRAKLREAYGPCFLWNQVPIDQDVSLSTRHAAGRNSSTSSTDVSPARHRREDIIEVSVERAMKAAPWMLASTDTSHLVS